MFSSKILQVFLLSILFLTWPGSSHAGQVCPVCAPPQTMPKWTAPFVGGLLPVLPTPSPSWSTLLCQTTGPAVMPQPLPIFGSQEPLPMEPAPTLPTDEEAAQALQNLLRQPSFAEGEPRVIVQTLCVQVPAGFCQQAGLNAAAPSTAWVLTPRETKMFQALLKAEPCKQVVTRPQLIVADQQTGCVQVGQQVPIVTALEAASQNGSTVYIARTEMRSTGVQLQVTPQIKQEGKTVLLRVQGNFAEMEGAPVQMPVVTAAGQAPETANAVRTVAFLAAVNSREFQTTVELPAGCATVICTSGATGVNGRKTSETLWVLTAHPVGKTK